MWHTARTYGRWTQLLLLAIVCFNTIGCIKFYSRRPVPAVVRDAETGVMIPNAEVRVAYPNILILNGPKPDVGVTDESGRVLIRAATFKPQRWLASAEGYLPLELPSASDLPKTAEFDLYRAPAPTLTIVVPNGYRGPLKVDLQPIPQPLQEKAGARHFTVRASSNGYMGVPSTPLLLNIDVHNSIKVLYENGEAIPVESFRMGPSDVAFRWQARSIDGRRLLYVVGTTRDFEAIRPIIYEYVGGDPLHVRMNYAAFDKLFTDSSSASPAQAVPDHAPGP